MLSSSAMRVLSNSCQLVASTDKEMFKSLIIVILLFIRSAAFRSFIKVSTSCWWLMLFCLSFFFWFFDLPAPSVLAVSAVSRPPSITFPLNNTRWVYLHLSLEAINNPELSGYCLEGNVIDGGLDTAETASTDGAIKSKNQKKRRDKIVLKTDRMYLPLWRNELLRIWWTAKLLWLRT